MKRTAKVLLILLVTLISYGQTIFMYFWQDDSALIFKLQHQAEIAGSFGRGLFDRGPYRYLVVPFVPFFPFFRLNPLGYFFVGFLSYLLVVISFYWMVKVIFNNKRTTYLATIIISAGYIGSDTMFRVINSWQTNIGITLGLVLFGLYIRFQKTHKSRLYYISLVIYLCAIEFVFIRSHAVLATLFAIELAFVLNDLNPLKKVIGAILRLIPFIFLFSVWYLKDASFGAPGIKSLFTLIFSKGEFTLLLPLLSNFGNLFLPDKILSLLLSIVKSSTTLSVIIVSAVVLTSIYLVKKKVFSKKFLFICSTALVFMFVFINASFMNPPYYFRDYTYFGSSLVATAIIFLSFVYFLSTNNKNIRLAILVGIVTIFAQIGSYYIQYPTAVFNTTHRYFSYAFIGYALLVGSLLDSIKTRKLINIILLLIVSPALILGWRYQSNLLATRSIPSKLFYTKLLSEVPNLKKGSVMMFDVDRDSFLEHQFGDFFGVGSMPDTTALAIYYGIDRYDVTMVNSYDELFYLIDNGVKTDDVYSFRYTKDGLFNTTNEVREMINTSKTSDLNNSLPLYTYQKLTFNIKANWNKYLPGEFAGKLPISKLVDAIKMSIEQRRYYKTVIARSESEWKTREIENIIDNNVETAWQGHRIHWYNNRHDEVIIDLLKESQISALKWTNWRSSLTPLSYAIYTSSDNKKWKLISQIIDGGEKKDSEDTLITFSAVNTRYVKMEITKTLTDDSPAISEIVLYSKSPETISKNYFDYLNSPFAYVSSVIEWNDIIAANDGFAPIKVSVSTKMPSLNKNEYILYTPVNGRNYQMEVIIPPGGQKIKDISVTSTYPINMILSDFKLESMNLNEMKDNSLIRRFSEN